MSSNSAFHISGRYSPKTMVGELAAEGIRGLTSKGSVMGITAVHMFVKNKQPTLIEDVVDHITTALARRGNSDSNTQAVLGGNFRRLLGSASIDRQNKTGENA
jgi:microsomal dipeptidase-like Zn-dependent dipeptidase